MPIETIELIVCKVFSIITHSHEKTRPRVLLKVFCCVCKIFIIIETNWKLFTEIDMCCLQSYNCLVLDAEKVDVLLNCPIWWDYFCPILTTWSWDSWFWTHLTFSQLNLEISRFYNKNCNVFVSSHWSWDQALFRPHWRQSTVQSQHKVSWEKLSIWPNKTSKTLRSVFQIPKCQLMLEGALIVVGNEHCKALLASSFHCFETFL